jgi:hypothetical protein
VKLVRLLADTSVLLVGVFVVAVFDAGRPRHTHRPSRKWRRALAPHIALCSNAPRQATTADQCGREHLLVSELRRKQRDLDRAREVEDRVAQEVNELDRRIRVADAKGDSATVNVLKAELDRAMSRYRDAMSDVEGFRGVLLRHTGP